MNKKVKISFKNIDQVKNFLKKNCNFFDKNIRIEKVRENTHFLLYINDKKFKFKKNYNLEGLLTYLKQIERDLKKEGISKVINQISNNVKNQNNNELDKNNDNELDSFWNKFSLNNVQIFTLIDILKDGYKLQSVKYYKDLTKKSLLESKNIIGNLVKCLDYTVYEKNFTLSSGKIPPNYFKRNENNFPSDIDMLRFFKILITK